jgi:hypothetical protein
VKNTKTKIVIIALMFVTFFGQALASVTMSCTHEMAMELSMMTHDNMPDTASHARMMIESNDQGSGLMDCCQEQCKCPMNGCVSPSLLSDTRFKSGVIAEHKISQLPLLHQSQINASLYRPPIS